MSRIRVVVFRATLSQGGADRVALTLLKHLSRERFQPELLLMRREGELLDEVPDDVRVVSLDVRGLRYSLGAMTRFFRVSDHDVFLSLDSGGNVIALAASLRLRDSRPVIISERNVLWNGGFSLSRAAQVALKKLCYRWSHRLVCVSEDQKRQLRRQLSLPDASLVTIYNPVVTDDLDALAAAPVPHPWLDEEVPVVLWCGRLVPQKNPMLFLEALRNVRPPWRALILGDGPLRESLEARVRELALSDRVRFLGFEKNPYAFMSRAAVYVLSSDNEGLPGTLIQAMACGAACVATDCPTGPAEILEDGRTGFLIAPEDCDSLVQHIDRLLDDPALRYRIATAARAAATERFSAQASIEAYENCIADVASC